MAGRLPAGFWSTDEGLRLLERIRMMRPDKSWEQIAAVVEQYCGRRVTAEAMRMAYRNAQSPGGPKPAKPSDKSTDISASLLALLGKGPQVIGDDLYDALNCSPKQARAAVDELRLKGYDVQQIDDTLLLNQTVVPDDKRIDHRTNDGKIRFALVSDTHLCSKAQQLTYLNEFYDEVEQRGIRRVYHSGDILAGQNVYRGQLYEIFKTGLDDQVRYVIDNYPKRRGVKTSFVTGNHDLDFFKRDGADVGVAIQAGRPDMEYCGKMGAWVELTDNLQIYLLHMDGGLTYAITYRSQRIIDAFPGGIKPRIVAFGHDHQRIYYFRRNVHAIHAGCFEGQTLFLKRKGISPEIGGWFCEIDVDDEGGVTDFNMTARVWFKEIPHDY